MRDIDISPEKDFYKQHRGDFMQLRTFWSMDEERYNDEMFETTFVKGAGKSGMKMWFSKNKILFIKELSSGDRESLKNIMKKYTIYMLENKDSLLPKFHGVYKNGNTVFIVQENLNQYDKGTWVYDLKGSRRHRTTDEFSIEKIGKDNNFGSSKIYMEKAEEVKEQMRKDTNFLQENNLMDYSLLTCIRNEEGKEGKEKNWIKSNRKYCCKFQGPGPLPITDVNLNIGIIDILQNYNMKKALESFFRTKQHANSRHKSEVSAINSKSYKKRFDIYMNSILRPYEELEIKPNEDIFIGGSLGKKRKKKRKKKRTKKRIKKRTKKRTKRTKRTKKNKRRKKRRIN